MPTRVVTKSKQQQSKISLFKTDQTLDATLKEEFEKTS